MEGHLAGDVSDGQGLEGQQRDLQSLQRVWGRVSTATHLLASQHPPRAGLRQPATEPSRAQRVPPARITLPRSA